MLYAWLLLVCPIDGRAPCLQPQMYYSEQTCKRVGNAYLEMPYASRSARCVQVPRKDVR